MIIFTVPKAFREEFGSIQQNAIDSWLAINPKPKIILLGNEAGIEGIAKQKRLTHIKHIKKNRYGTPLLHDIFEKAQHNLDEDVLMYINCDVILANSPMPAVEILTHRFNHFLAVGKRYEGQVKKRMSIDEIRKMAHSPNLKQKGNSWIDYFIFTKGVFDSIPPFALGRTFWDKWLVWSVLAKYIPVVDVTKQLCAIHQSHRYSLSSKTTIKTIWAGEEALENLRQAGGWAHCSTIADASFRLENNTIYNQNKKFMQCRSLLDLFPILWPVFLRIRLWREQYSLIMNQKR